jgi:anti-sigma B factor antagonist
MLSSTSQFQDGLLKVRRTLEGDRLRLAFDGELDLANVRTAETVLRDALLSDGEVVIDLRGLEFLDSSGIALLFAAMKEDRGGRLGFLPSEALEVRRVLRLTGLDQKMALADAGSPAASRAA